MHRETIAVPCLIFIGLLHISGSHEHAVQSTSKDPETIVIPSVVYNCSVAYINHMNKLINRPNNELTTPEEIAGNIMSFIEVLCSPLTQYGVNFLTCLSRELPGSPFTVDHVLAATINQSSLSGILVSGCKLRKPLNASLACTIQSLMLNPSSLSCVTDIERYFTTIIASLVTAIKTHQVLEFCRTWGSMVRCIAPYLAVCNPNLSNQWLLYGRSILTESCRDSAFEKSEAHHQLEDTHSVLHKLFQGDASAVTSCLVRHQQGMAYLLPTSVVSHTMDPSQFVTALVNMCGTDVGPFMYCLDEKRLHVSSETDRFTFSIISTTNMRTLHKQICTQLEVIKRNMHCLLNAAMELTTCQCYVTGMRQVLDVSQHNNVPYRNRVEPFCGLYTSYVRCYIGLIAHCSYDLGLLLRDIYIEPLTGTCRGAKPAPCSPVQNQYQETSGVIQCGEPVSNLASSISASFNGTDTASGTVELTQMMGHMEGLILAAYEYTCSIGETLKQCVRNALLLSGHPLDVLLMKMFDHQQFDVILKEGCQTSLIQDVRKKLKFLLSLMLSDPRMSTCVEKMGRFSLVLMDKVDVHSHDTLVDYCRIWIEFSRCVETKLACTGSTLAQAWRHMTINILTQPCQDAAVGPANVERYNSGMCDMHHVVDSAVMICGMNYMTKFLERQDTRKEQNMSRLAIIVRAELHHFCQSKQKMALQMIHCLQTMIPHSFMMMDRLVQKVFNLSYLETLADSVCAQTSVLAERLYCLVDKMEAGNVESNCINNGLVESFTISDNPTDLNITDQITTACRGWYKFIYCMKPYIDSCDRSIGWLWKHLGLTALSPSCKQVLDLHMSRSCAGRFGHFPAYVLGSTALAVIIILHNCYFS